MQLPSNGWDVGQHGLRGGWRRAVELAEIITTGVPVAVAYTAMMGWGGESLECNIYAYGSSGVVESRRREWVRPASCQERKQGRSKQGRSKQGIGGASRGGASRGGGQVKTVDDSRCTRVCK